MEIKKPSSTPTSPNGLLDHPHSAFYASLQKKTDSILQLPITQSYDPKSQEKSPVMNNESYQRQMMFIHPVTSRPF
jgi:hypothetical protein